MTLASFRLFDFIHLRYADIITDNVESIFAHKETKWTILKEAVGEKNGTKEYRIVVFLIKCHKMCVRCLSNRIEWTRNESIEKYSVGFGIGQMQSSIQIVISFRICHFTTFDWISHFSCDQKVQCSSGLKQKSEMSERCVVYYTLP